MWVRWKFGRGGSGRAAIEYFADPHRTIAEKSRTLVLVVLVVVGLIALVFAIQNLIAWLAPSDEAAGYVFAAVFLLAVFGPLLADRIWRRRNQHSARDADER